MVAAVTALIEAAVAAVAAAATAATAWVPVMARVSGAPLGKVIEVCAEVLAR